MCLYNIIQSEISTKKMGRNAGTPGKCLVCGDNACGINYNVPSCMSCKTFFRRNALRQKEAICQFSDCCALDRITRKFCTRCRLKKCLQVGMNKAMIKSEDEKRELQEKIRLNRIKRFEGSKNLETNIKTLSPEANLNLATKSSLSTSKTLSIESTPIAEESMVLPGSLEPINESVINSNEMLDSYKNHSTLDNICQYLKDMDSVELSDIEVLPLGSKQQSESNQLVNSISSNLESETNLRSNLTKALNKEFAINSDEILDSYEINSTLDDICPSVKDMSPVELSDIEVIPLDSLDRFDKCPEIGMKKKFELHIGGKINRFKPKTDILTIDRISLFSNECTLNLKMYELSRLQEIYSAALAFPSESSWKIVGQVNSLSLMANLPAANMKHIVQFCKNMTEFSCLSKDEQVLTLKCSVPEINQIRAAFLYDTKTNGWAALEILVQSLFKHLPKMGINFEFVRYHNVVYHYLLRRYLEHKYLYTIRAAQKYSSLMGLLAKMDIATNTTRQFYANSHANTIQVVPVLKEIFNLHQT